LLHLWVIALFVALALRDSLDQPLLSGWLTPAEAAVATLGSMLLISLATHITIARCTAVLRRRGSWRAVLIAESAAAAARWGAVMVHMVAILALGWLDAVRAAVGDLVIVDELIALAPALLVFAWGWWALWPMERMLRTATLVRQLDDGVTVYPIPGRAEFVLLSLRHHVIVWLTPLFLIMAWSESMHRATAALADHIALLRDADTRALINIGLELLGVALVFLVLGPLAMRFVWHTIRLPAGELRDRLEAMCRRYSVRVSDILVWRTHGTMINGAVLGLTPAYRYVLLTDALLDSLPDEEVEAVMAHEVAHVRHRHIIWLALVMAGAITAAAWAGEYALRAAGIAPGEELPESLALGVAGVSFAAAITLFGIVSRRFEWQADAFAAAHMSERLRMLAPEAQAHAITADGAGAMAAALRSVARLNHVSLDRRSWRHGSIRVRLDRLASLVGLPASRLPPDRTSRAIKHAAALSLASLIALLALQFLLGA
jgi:STE24 endopeptidase